jgi:hypothetical protein
MTSDCDLYLRGPRDPESVLARFMEVCPALRLEQGELVGERFSAVATRVRPAGRIIVEWRYGIAPTVDVMFILDGREPGHAFEDALRAVLAYLDHEPWDAALCAALRQPLLIRREGELLLNNQAVEYWTHERLDLVRQPHRITTLHSVAALALL